MHPMYDSYMTSEAAAIDTTGDHLAKWGNRLVACAYHLENTHQVPVTSEQAGDLEALRAMHAGLHLDVTERAEAAGR